MKKPPRGGLRTLLRLLALVALSTVALQLVLVARVALTAVVDPRSTTFQRSEAWRLLSETRRLPWRAEWVDIDHISPQLQRAVIASEDAGFVDHFGVEWDAVEKAWGRNQRAEARAARQRKPLPPKVVGGSTITQQLAKNLLLSGERSVLRKAQELVLAWTLEAVLSKRRILEIYLNHVEWGQGVFGAQAAAQHYFRTDASRLSAEQAARLAVMLPAPKRHETRFAAGTLAARAATIVARMGAVELPPK